MTGTLLMLVGGGIGLLIAAAAAYYFFVIRPRSGKTLDQTYFVAQWQELQGLLANKKTWAEAITTADNLLEEALKRKRVGGKGIGERLVKVQRSLTNNDAVWFGHKLRRKLEHEPDIKLKEADVKQALVGIRQALKDLGALPNGQPRDAK